jgi:hypothetical protein
MLSRKEFEMNFELIKLLKLLNLFKTFMKYNNVDKIKIKRTILTLFIIDDD